MRPYFEADSQCWKNDYVLRADGEAGLKKELIEIARQIATESKIVMEVAKKVSEVCTNQAMRKVSVEV